MLTFFIVLFCFVIVQRLVELRIAHSNAKYMRSLGAVEKGAEHYRSIVGLHTLFFASFFTEVWISPNSSPDWWAIPFTFFLAAQALRMWILQSLGRFWNTRIFVLRGSRPVRSGLYRYIRHPNYVVVGTEILTLPLIFGAYYTAVMFTLLNYVLLRYVRIPAEEKALMESTSYEEEMAHVPRAFPSPRR